MIHTCTPSCRHDPSIHRVDVMTNFPLTIDLHCHILSPEVETLVAPYAEKRNERNIALKLIGEASVAHNESQVLPTARRRMTDFDLRLVDMDRMGVDVQVISPSPTQYYYWADEALARNICDVQNLHIARYQRLHPDRVRGLGAVSLQHPQLAVEQLKHCVKELGLLGIEISSTFNGQDISDESLEPFWAAANQLGCVVFLHPLGTSLGDRVATHYLSNIIGQPLETTIALSKLILNGVLDRYPDLRILAAHGGGYLPSYLGRLTHGVDVRPETSTPKHPPRHYLERIWFDTLIYDPASLRHLINTVGIDRLLVGTDYPFDMGDYDIHRLISAVPEITDREREMILGLNAARLLGIDSDVIREITNRRSLRTPNAIDL